MKEEDDMLELLDEEDLGADSLESDELELNDDSDEESPDDSLELEEPEEEAGESVISEGGEDEESGESGEEEEAEPEGLVLDIRYIAVAAVAIAAILIGVVFIALPMLADNPPVVSFSQSQVGEDLFLTHSGTDPLSPQYLTVLINGAPLPADKYMLMGGASWPWSQNSVLRIDTSGYAKPAPVTVVYKPKSTEFTIFGATAQPTPTPEPTPVPTPEPVITPDQAAQNGTISPDVTTGQPGEPQAVAPITPIPPAVLSDSITMAVSPVSGQAPLTVQCSDETVGCIIKRTWNFGDGQTSMKRSPSHVYAYPGTYNVTLDVKFCDSDDNPTVLPVQPVVVAPSDRHDTLASGTGNAHVLSGARIFFTVKGPGTNVRIGGRDHTLKSGDHVQLSLNSGGSGDISVVSNAILRCDYSNVTMNVNGNDVETGTISVININQYLQFETADLTIQVVTGRDGLKGMIDGQPVISATPGQILTLSNVGVDSSGKLLFSSQNSAGFSFRGGIGSHEVASPSPA